MKILKKSALSLAVAGVVYGTAVTPVYAVDVNVGAGGNGKVVGVPAGTGIIKTKAPDINMAVGDKVIVDQTITLADSDDDESGLTIDVDLDSDTDGVLEADIQIDAAIDASGESNGVSGLLIKTFDADGKDSLKGNIAVNANVEGGGGGAGVSSEVDIEGNITVKAGATATGSATGAGVSLKNVTGQITVNGDVGDGTVLTGMIINGAVSEGINISSTGNVQGATNAFDFQGAPAAPATRVNNVINNSGTGAGNGVNGIIKLAEKNTVTFNNKDGGVFVGSTSVAGTGDDEATVNWNNEAGSTATFNANSELGVLENADTGTVKLAGNVILTLTDVSDNKGTIEETSSGTTGLMLEADFTNSGGIIVDSIDSNTGKTVTITNSKNITTNFASTGVTNLVNQSGGVVTADASTIDELTNNSGAEVKLSATLTLNEASNNYGKISDNGSSAIVASKAFTNHSGGEVDVDKFTVSENSSNAGSFTTSELALAAGKTYTNTSTTIIRDGNGITGTGTFANNGTLKFTGDASIADAAQITSTGNIYLGYEADVTLDARTLKSGSMLTAEDSSSLIGAGFDGTSGTLKLVATTAGAATNISTLVNTNGIFDVDSGNSGDAEFNASSKIVVTGTDDILKYSGTATENKKENVVLVKAATITYDSTETLSEAAKKAALEALVGSGSVLMQVSNVEYVATSNWIEGDLEVVSAASKVSGYGLGSVAQTLATKFQGMTAALTNPNNLDSIKTQNALFEAYGSLNSNATSDSGLKAYVDNVRPDDSNSAAASAATAGQAAMSNIASRSANVRTGANYGGMQAAGGFWVQGLYGKSDQKEREGSLGYKGDLRGMSFGLDREMGGSTTGIAFSYGKSDVDFDRDQKDMVKSYIASVYNVWEHGKMYVDSSLSVGSSKHESKRVNGTANADYGSLMLGGQAMVGYYMNYGDVMFEPKAGARLTMVNVDGHTRKLDDGTVFETVQDQSYRQMELGFGATVSKSFAVANGALTPSFGVMYYHDMVGDQMDAQVNFAGDDYAIKGASAVKGSWEINLGLDYAMGENLTMSAGYTRVMKNDFSSDNFNAKLKYMF